MTPVPSGPSVRVVYVLAVQNSGSTMLDAMLGAAPGARSLGEFAGFHRISEGKACDCGRIRTWCGACTAVTAALESAAPRGEWVGSLDQVMGGRRLGWTVLPSPARRRYARLANVALAAAAEAMQTRTLIDSSKNIARVAALLGDHRHGIYVVHLVRRPSGYLESRRRRATRFSRRSSAPTILAHWLLKNLLAATVVRWRAGRGRYLFIRTEDLLADPARVLERIAVFTGLDLAGVADQAVGAGIRREHLYEPKRVVDYSTIRLDPSRLLGGTEADPA